MVVHLKPKAFTLALHIGLFMSPERALSILLCRAMPLKTIITAFLDKTVLSFDN